MVAHSHDAAARRRRSPTVLHQQKRRGGRGDGVVTRVVKKGPEPGELSDDEAEYRAMMKQTKEWMAYDPDELPESAPAPWETHVQNLMKNGPWRGIYDARATFSHFRCHLQNSSLFHYIPSLSAAPPPPPPPSDHCKRLPRVLIYVHVPR